MTAFVISRVFEQIAASSSTFLKQIELADKALMQNYVTKLIVDSRPNWL
jgi:hypothetical protein